MPSTCLSIKFCKYADSMFTSFIELHKNDVYPNFSACASLFNTSVEKNGWLISGNTNPIIFDCLYNRLLAKLLGLKLYFLIILVTFFIVSGCTRALPVNTLETVEGDTPASLAMSYMVILPFFISFLPLLRIINTKN